MCMNVSKVGLRKKKPARPKTINVMQLNGCFDFVPGTCIWVLQRYMRLSAQCAPSCHVIRLYCTGALKCNTVQRF